VDRHSGNGAVGRPFWLSTGPATSDSALACSTGREALNLGVTASLGAAMALAVYTLRDTQDGWPWRAGER